jgi:hypothetical protein
LGVEPAAELAVGLDEFEETEGDRASVAADEDSEFVVVEADAAAGAFSPSAEFFAVCELHPTAHSNATPATNVRVMISDLLHEQETTKSGRAYTHKRRPRTRAMSPSFSNRPCRRAAGVSRLMAWPKSVRKTQPVGGAWRRRHQPADAGRSPELAHFSLARFACRGAASKNRRSDPLFLAQGPSCRWNCAVAFTGS